MFGYTYKYKLNPANNTIKLRPTLTTTIKAFGPVWLVFGALWLIGTYAEKKLDKNDPEMNPPKN